MSTHYDEKGKFFTDVISKKNIPVTIQTLHNRIKGAVHIRRGERLKDELNSAEQFLAVTDAIIFDLQGAELNRMGFLVLNRDNIIWLFPTNGEDTSTGEQI